MNILYVKGAAFCVVRRFVSDYVKPVNKFLYFN